MISKCTITEKGRSDGSYATGMRVPYVMDFSDGWGHGHLPPRARAVEHSSLQVQHETLLNQGRNGQRWHDSCPFANDGIPHDRV